MTSSDTANTRFKEIAGFIRFQSKVLRGQRRRIGSDTEGKPTWGLNIKGYMSELGKLCDFLGMTPESQETFAPVRSVCEEARTKISQLAAQSDAAELYGIADSDVGLILDALESVRF